MRERERDRETERQRQIKREAERERERERERETLLIFSLLISEDIWVFLIFSAIAVYLHLLIDVLKMLQSLQEFRENPEILTN